MKRKNSGEGCLKLIAVVILFAPTWVTILVGILISPEGFWQWMAFLGGVAYWIVPLQLLFLFIGLKIWLD